MKKSVKKILIPLIILCLFLTGIQVSAATSQKVKSMGKVTLTVGAKKTLTIKNTGKKKVTWKSSNTKIASVTQKGAVTARKAGTAKITATVGSASKYVWNLTVKPKKVLVSKITLNKTSASITMGKTLTLKATVAPKNASNKKVTWSSSNTGVASVSSKGVVTAKKAGTATITVTAKDGSKKKATCKVTVKRPKAASVKISGARNVMIIGETLSLTASVTPAGASSAVTWKSSNTAVAAVSKKGTVTAKKAGTVTITATASDGSKKSASCTIRIERPKASALKIGNAPTSLTVGASRQLTATITPAEASQEVTWKSSAPKIASVSSKGLVTAVSPGTVTITAAAADGSGLSISCQITVKAKVIPIEKLTITGYHKTLTVGKTMQLKVEVTPAEACSEFTWKSSNPKAATVSAAGLVTAVAPGKTTITAAAANDSGASVSADVEVIAEAAAKTVTGITASCSLSSVSNPDEITADTLTVYELYDDGTKAELKNFSVKVSEDTSKNVYVVTITAYDGKFTAQVTVKKQKDTSAPSYVRTDISCRLTEVEYGYRFTTSDFTVVDVYSDGSVKPVAFDVTVSPYEDGCYTVVIKTANAEKTLKIKVKNPPEEPTDPKEPEETITKYRFQLDPDYVYTGENLKPGQLRMFVTYSGSSEETEVTDFVCDFTPKDTPGVYPFHITWKNLTEEHTITVKERPSEEPTLTKWTAKYAKTYIFSDETPSKEDITVTGTYSDGSTKAITDFTFDFVPASAHKEKAAIHVNYHGGTITLQVTSYVRTETASIKYGLAVSSVGVNEPLDKSKVSVIAVDYDGNETTVTDFEIDFTPKSEPGTYSFHIYYKGFTGTLEITVK